MKRGMNGNGRLARISAATLAAAVLTAGCEVINPGPVNDEFIALPASQRGLVNGSWERLNRVIGGEAHPSAIHTREVFHGGQTGSYSGDTPGGNMGNWSASGPYNTSQQARWIAEEAIRRFEERGDVGPDIMTEAYLAAGYANRINGDIFCWGVIDGGPLVEGSHYWERAEGHFTNAIATAPDAYSKQAAYAGRAQARLELKDYAGAVADAQQVPDDFVIHVELDFSKGGNTGQRNHVYWSQADNPFRSWTTLHTFYHGYYVETGDPRVPWAPFPNPSARFCLGALQGYGQVPCFQQKKYVSQDDDIRIASGAEMRLIEAEAMLRTNPGNWQAAMAIINANRTRYLTNSTLGVGGTIEGGAPLQPWVANNLDDAWTFLMRERGIEFWLEARRRGDLRRWEPYILEYGTLAADGQTIIDLQPTTPGTLDWPRFEDVMLNKASNIFSTTQRGRPAFEDQTIPREYCYNISTTERNNNPHFDDAQEP
jgi:starch-binding outer membrane protein, SusD/RagB family